MPVDSWYISSFTTYLQRWKPTVTVIFPSWMMIYEFELRQLRDGYRLSLTLPSVCFGLSRYHENRPEKPPPLDLPLRTNVVQQDTNRGQNLGDEGERQHEHGMTRAMGKKGFPDSQMNPKFGKITDLHVNLVISTSLSGSFPQGVRLKIHWNHQ